MSDLSPSVDQATCEEHLARFLSACPLPGDGRVEITPHTLGFFPGVPVETVRSFLAAKGLLGDLAQLDVLLPAYLAAHPDALEQGNALNTLRAWLRARGCRPQTIQILRHLRHMGHRFSLKAMPANVVEAVQQMFNNHPRLLTQPVCYNGPGGLIAFARGQGICADTNTLIAIFEAFPLTIARGQAVGHNRLDRSVQTPAEIATSFCQRQAEGPVPVAGPHGLIAHLASHGVLLNGRAVAGLIENAGRQAQEVVRAPRRQIVAALNRVIGDVSWGKRPRQITGASGLFAQVLRLGVDCSADSVKRAYVRGGGRTKSSVVRRAQDYSRRLPALLLRLRETEADFFSAPVPVRGPGGLKDKVWKEGVHANHEIIRRYAEAVGIELRKGARTACAA